jgi:hypothetical protein
MSESNGQYVSPPPPPPPRSRRGPLVLAIGGLVAVAAVVGLVLGFGPGTSTSQAAPPTSDAQPYVREFARNLSGEVRNPLPTPEVFSYGPTVDGCDHNYGVRGECVPYNFPPQVPETVAGKCAYLASHKFRSLEVAGTDRQHLAPAGGPKAPSGNPYACPRELPTG